MAYPAVQMLKNFGKLVVVSLWFFTFTILSIFSGFIASKVCILFWQFFSFARLKIPATVKAGARRH
jgi:hypothetical protein